MQLNDFSENYGNGWISIYRSVKKHWIWKDPIKFQWWIDILLEVNHSKQTINIGYDLFDCDRGQSIKSLKSWADNWNVSKDTVRNFFTLLKKDNMIKTENLKKTTRITVCKYDTYQTQLHDKQTPSKRKPYDKQTPDDPNNNDNNDNNVNKIYSLYPSKCPINNSGTGKTKTNKDKIKKLLEIHSVKHLELIINSYIEDCKNSNRYIKNFGTFLNNLPEQDPEPVKIKKEFVTYHRQGIADRTCSIDEWPEIQKTYGPQITGFDKTFKEVAI